MKTKIARRMALVIIGFLTVSSIALAAMTAAERAQAYYKQGYLYYQEGSYSKAIGEYDKAISLSPSMAKAYYWRGKAYYEIKDYESAKQDIIKAMNLAPGTYGPGLLKKVEAESGTTTVATTPQPKAQPQPAGKNLISMNLRAAEISNAFHLLAKETGQNIVVSKDVHGRITLSLNNVTHEQAFEAILKASNCTYEKEGNIIRIIPTGKPRRVQVLPGGLLNKTYTIDYVETEHIAATLKDLLPEGTKVITTPGSNYVVVEGFESAIEKADAIIENLDTPPEQVMVEAKIMEVSKNVGSALGLNLTYTNPDNPNETVQTKGLAGAPTATGATGLYYSVTNQDLEALLEALEATTNYNILSSPKVMALNGEEAEIITGQRLGYKVSTITETGLVESVEFLDVGTKLVFTPRIKSDGQIMMEIHPEISEGSIVGDLPQKKSTETTTNLLVRDGDTIIIGGLMKDVSQKENKGIPFLSDIPFIGVPFRRTEITTEKREIIVLISPHIVTPEFLERMAPEAEKLEKKREEHHYESPMDLVM